MPSLRLRYMSPPMPEDERETWSREQLEKHERSLHRSDGASVRAGAGEPNNRIAPDGQAITPAHERAIEDLRSAYSVQLFITTRAPRLPGRLLFSAPFAAVLAQPTDEPSDHQHGQQERDDHARADEHIGENDSGAALDGHDARRRFASMPLYGQWSGSPRRFNALSSFNVRLDSPAFEQFEKLKAAEESERDIITRLVGKIARKRLR
jgi:hypothetical protein